jgi:2'-phosphotransferase
MRNASKEELLRIATNCPKQRFHVEYFVDEITGLSVPFMRANQGHSLKNINVDMVELHASDLVDQCIHGTYFKAWESIKTQVPNLHEY